MDMMDVRRMVMSQMAGSETLPTGWHKLTITNPSAITLGGGLSALIENNVPNCLYAVGIILCEFTNAIPENSTVYEFNWTGQALQSTFVRFMNGEVDALNPRVITDTYACKIPQGSKIIIYYHDPLTT